MDSEIKLKVVGNVILWGFLLCAERCKDGLVLSLCTRRWSYCRAVSTELVFQVMRLVCIGLYEAFPPWSFSSVGKDEQAGLEANLWPYLTVSLETCLSTGSLPLPRWIKTNATVLPLETLVLKWNLHLLQLNDYNELVVKILPLEGILL